MKKYKLIRSYPNCHVAIGVLAWTEGCDTHFSNGSYIPNEITVYENYPEFWELVEGKEYEILSFVSLTDFSKGQVFYDCQRSEKRMFSYLSNVKSGISAIHSVKRLSDGEVFTIGDKVINKTRSLYHGIISEIYISNNKLELYVATTINGNMGLFLNNVVKAKQPLFTTEDGVEIFEGDNIYWINLFTLDKVNCNEYYDDLGECDLKDGLISLKDFNKSNKHQDISFIGFSTKEAAEEYILLNKPVLSAKDCFDLFNRHSTDYSTSFRQKTEILVKSKL